MARFVSGRTANRGKEPLNTSTDGIAARSDENSSQTLPLVSAGGAKRCECKWMRTEKNCHANVHAPYTRKSFKLWHASRRSTCAARKKISFSQRRSTVAFAGRNREGWVNKLNEVEKTGLRNHFFTHWELTLRSSHLFFVLSEILVKPQLGWNFQGI